VKGRENCKKKGVSWFAGCSSPNIVRTINSRKLRWARHIIRMGAVIMHTIFPIGNLKTRYNLGDLDEEGRIILKLIQRSRVSGCGLNSRKGPVVGFCEHRSDPSGSIKDGEFLDQLSSRQFFRKDSPQ
jgi:hypothetical protein